jgi:hypothetical protein
MRRFWPRLVLLALVALLGRAGPAAATVMLEASVEDLTRESDAVVRGKVASAEGHRSADGKRIFTRVTVEVAEAWKGAPGKTVVVQVPGGVYGDIGQIVHGAPTFVPGEEVVVFLRRQPGRPDGAAPTFHVAGLAQGKLRIDRDAVRGPVAVADLRGLELKRRSGVPAAPAPAPAPIPVPELRARVEAASR